MSREKCAFNTENTLLYVSLSYLIYRDLKTRKNETLVLKYTLHMRQFLLYTLNCPYILYIALFRVFISLIMTTTDISVMLILNGLLYVKV